MEGGRALRRRRRDDRLAHELVAESHGSPLAHEAAHGEALLEEAFVRPRHFLEEGGRERRPEDGGGLEHAEGRRVEASRAREHGVAKPGGDPDAARGEKLGDEERVASGPAVEVAGVDSAALGEKRDRLEGQGREGDRRTPDAVARSPSATRRGCFRSRLLVAVGRDQKHP